jgi:hypothetical protein
MYNSRYGGLFGSLTDNIIAQATSQRREIEKQINGLSGLAGSASLASISNDLISSRRTEIEKQINGLSGLARSTSLASAYNNLIASKTIEIDSQFKGLSDLVKSTSLASSLWKSSPDYLAAANITKQIGSLSSFRALEKFAGEPFSKLGFDLYSNDVLLEDGVLDRAIIKADSEILQELENCDNYENLSNQAKKTLLYLYHFYFLPLLFTFAGVVMGILYPDEIKKILSPLTSKTEIKSATKRISKNFDKELLSEYRVTIKNNISLKETSKLKCKDIEFLPIGTLVKLITIDTKEKNRAWLYVEVEINGKNIRGWLLRSYTTYFK